jgi:undecaprenyl-diphosphatase
MTLIQVLVLSLIQGLTEFLPISSSAHLILGSKVFEWPDQGLIFDVATHLGTLLAVLVYFRRELWGMVTPWFGAKGENESSRKLGLTLVVASIPAIVAGGLLHSWVESVLRDTRIIAYSTICFGLLLWWADARFPHARKLADMNLNRGFLIGLAQMLALVPGTSRSGITMTMGRILGFDADAAARFSFLLSIPVIAAAGGYGMLRMFMHEAAINWGQFGLAVLFSAIAGWLCIAAFLALLQRVGLLPFVIYRLLLGVALLWITF